MNLKNRFLRSCFPYSSFFFPVLELPDFLILDGIDLRRSGGTFIARCPFHEERSPSFTVWPDHAHCYGCGWHGGIFKYVMERWSCDYPRALEILKERGCTPPPRKINLEASNPGNNEKPELPELWPLNEDGIHALAKRRCLSPAGIRRACKAGVLFGCRWPQRYESHQSWCVTDSSRNVAQFRRFDGKPYQMRDREIRSWTKGSPSWPVGTAALETAEVPNVVMVEGGPDLLAAYHLLASVFKVGPRFVSPEFTPVAMLGAANKISGEARALFAGKRVRILRHDDDAGVKGAAQWTEQLAAAGASVATCCFSRLSSQKQMLDALLDFDF